MKEVAMGFLEFKSGELLIREVPLVCLNLGVVQFSACGVHLFSIGLGGCWMVEKNGDKHGISAIVVVLNGARRSLLACVLRHHR